MLDDEEEDRRAGEEDDDDDGATLGERGDREGEERGGGCVISYTAFHIVRDTTSSFRFPPPTDEDPSAAILHARTTFVAQGEWSCGV